MGQFIFVSLIILHVLLCVFLVLLILLQNDKGGGLAGAFGGMGGSAAFSGSSTATFLTKITWYLAGASFLLILGLNWFAMSGNDASVRESELRAARKGLSSVLPAAPAGPRQGPVQGIPGLGTSPAPGAQEGAPVGAPAGEAPAGGDTQDGR